MEFAQLVALFALFAGPVGVYLGWRLSEKSARQRARDQELKEARRDDVERAVQLARSARRLSSMSRTLAHGYFLRSTQRVTESQLTQNISTFNRTRDEFRDRLLEVRLLGPSWVVVPAQRVDDFGQGMTELVMDMQREVTSSNVKQANSRIPEMDAALDELVAAISGQYASRCPH